MDRFPVEEMGFADIASRLGTDKPIFNSDVALLLERIIDLREKVEYLNSEHRLRLMCAVVSSGALQGKPDLVCDEVDLVMAESARRFSERQKKAKLG